MTDDKLKKFKAIRKHYVRVEDTYWEEFEMTQDKWTELYKLTDESFKKHLTEKMSTKINDWKHLYTCVSTADFKNIKEKTNATFIEESEVEIEEVKK